MNIDFAEESGSVIITLNGEESTAPIEVIYDGGATVLITVAGGKVVNVQILLNREATERLARALKTCETLRAKNG